MREGQKGTECGYHTLQGVMEKTVEITSSV